ncbi:hypothetical protein KIN20_031980 [Parelaphostrongylus tenuis]|uniref:Uncharacterized protein n=1 Tax=Parelaphostrongylus tenuis TaxID=148309 RepID=A0AAD5R5X0_PARTN|nr:hypothetical protein KIN20_031980 [Parelaphostrongylus tenuis]
MPSAAPRRRGYGSSKPNHTASGPISIPKRRQCCCTPKAPSLTPLEEKSAISAPTLQSRKRSMHDEDRPPVQEVHVATDLSAPRETTRELPEEGSPSRSRRSKVGIERKEKDGKSPKHAKKRAGVVSSRRESS